MRIKFKNILFVFLLSVISLMCRNQAWAQDANFPGTETEDLGMDKEKEKLIYSAGELDPSFRKTQASSSKDSVTLKHLTRPTKVQTPDASKAPVKQPSHDDDSVLSFNFLYYIFQKYKMQDIVD